MAPLFGPLLFGPIERMVTAAASPLRRLRSGRLDFRLAPIGLLLVAILVVALL